MSFHGHIRVELMPGLSKSAVLHSRTSAMDNVTPMPKHDYVFGYKNYQNSKVLGHTKTSDTQKTRYDAKRHESPLQNNTTNFIEVRGVSARHLPNTFNQELTLDQKGYLSNGPIPDVVGIRYFVKQNKICAWTSRPKGNSSGYSIRGILKSRSGSLCPSSSLHDSVKSSISASLQSSQVMQLMENGREICDPDVTLKDKKNFRLQSPGIVSSTPVPVSNVSKSIQQNKLRVSGLGEESESFKRYRCLHATPRHNGSGDTKLETEIPETKMKPISSPDSALPKLMKNKNGDVSFHQIINGRCEKEKVPKLRQRSSKQVGQSLADARRRFENRQNNCQEKPVEQGAVVTSSSSETVMDRDQLISMQVKDVEVKPPCEGPSTTPRVTTTQGDDTQTKVRDVEPGFKTLSAEELQKRSVTTFEKTVFILKWIKDVQRLCPTIHPENYFDSPDTNPKTQPCSQNL